MKQFDRDKFRQIMLVRGYTQTELAEKVGVAQGAICSWSLGRRSPSLVHMKRLADALNVDISNLTKDEGIVEKVVFQEAEAATATPMTPMTPMKILEVEKKPKEVKKNRDELLCSALEAATELLRTATEILKESRRDEA